MTQRDLLIELLNVPLEVNEGYSPAEAVTDYLLDSGVVLLPCKIGETVYFIRNVRGGKKCVQQGTVSDMLFLKDMQLQIVVKGVGRGRYGETVFLTREAAEKVLAESGKDDLH